jgi:proteic killer suppression protein
MIVGFRHRGLRRLFEDDDRSRLPPEQVEKIAVILARLDAAEQIREMNAPGLRLHRLAGRLKGFWSVTVTANWRIIFRFEDGKALDVDLVDYH